MLFHPSRLALEIWTPQQLQALWIHLNNGNEENRYTLGAQPKPGKSPYFRPKRLPVAKAISWALASLRPEYKPEKRVSFVPLSHNAAHVSVWGAFDFDAHDGNWGRARQFAERAAKVMLRYEFASIVEESGGGFHVWAIARHPKAIAVWREFLENTAIEIEAAEALGLCEIFPSVPRRADGIGKGMRAPGSWHPKRGEFSRITYQSCNELLDFLSGKSSSPLLCEFPDKETSNVSRCVSKRSDALLKWKEKVSTSLGIVVQGTRHAKLKALVGQFFFQVSLNVGRELALYQYRNKKVLTSATEAEHLHEFDQLWAGMGRVVDRELTPAERTALGLLGTDNEREAFRIIRSFARLAQEESRDDFPIARDDLAERLGLTPQGAGLLRAKFVRLGFLRETQPYIANLRAARFAWSLWERTESGGANEPF